MITRSDSSNGGLVIHVTGAFDPEAGRQLADALAVAEPDSRFVIDFSRAATFPDFAVAMLAENIQGAVGSVSLVGLGDHQRRILSYFGVEHLEKRSAAKSEEEGPQ
jgi:STAS domain